MFQAACLQIMVQLAEKKARPDIPEETAMPGGTFRGMQGYLQLMEQCWSEDISERPTCENVIISLRGLLERATANQRDLQKTLTGKEHGAKPADG